MRTTRGAGALATRAVLAAACLAAALLAGCSGSPEAADGPEGPEGKPGEGSDGGEGGHGGDEGGHGGGAAQDTRIGICNGTVLVASGTDAPAGSRFAVMLEAFPSSATAARLTVVDAAGVEAYNDTQDPSRAPVRWSDVPLLAGAAYEVAWGPGGGSATFDPSQSTGSCLPAGTAQSRPGSPP